MNTVFRIDDVTAYTPGCGDGSPSSGAGGDSPGSGSNGSRFLTVLSMLMDAGAPPLLGIVPDLRDETLSSDISADRNERDERFMRFSGFVHELRERGCETAMHGFRHLYTTLSHGIFPLNGFSEFAGVPEEEQFRRISTGKNILEKAGLQTTLFMAPGHTFDKTTLKVLKACGFTGVTDGFGRRPYLRQGLTFYPIAFNTEKDARSPGDGWTTVVLHPCTMSGEGLERLSGMLKDPAVRPRPYSDFLREKPVNANAFSIAREYALAAFKRSYVSLRGNAGDPGRHIGETYVYDE